MARKMFEFERVRLVNVLALPSYRSGGLSDIAAPPRGWLEARPEMEQALGEADVVLLACGVGERTGLTQL